MTEPTPPPPPPPPGPGWSGSTPGTVSAVIAHAGGIVAGFLAPLVVYLVTDRSDAFNRTEAAEALNFQLTLLLAWMVGIVGAIIMAIATFGIALFAIVPLFFVVQIGATILMIVAAVTANRGEHYRYPINIRFVQP